MNSSTKFQIVRIHLSKKRRIKCLVFIERNEIENEKELGILDGNLLSFHSFSFLHFIVMLFDFLDFLNLLDLHLIFGFFKAQFLKKIVCFFHGFVLFLFKLPLFLLALLFSFDRLEVFIISLLNALVIFS